jgi:hypothetical protein
MTATTQRLDPMPFALQKEGRGFGPGGSGAPLLPPAPAKPPPRTIREGDILLGAASNGDQVGVSLAKLIEGRLLIQGNSGAGKSMLVRRLFEQAFGRIQQLLLDRDGEFSTLAEKFDVAVLTAADVMRIGGHAFALHLRQHRYSAVLDLSDATSEQCLATVADLVTGLVEAPPEHWHPMLVLVDETQTLVPRYDPGDVEPETRKRTVRAIADMMGRGRKRGLAGIIATGRIAETSTPVIAKPTNIVVGRTIFDRDLERAGASLGFTAGHSRALRTLADGEFLGIGPAFNSAARIRFRAGPVQSRHKGDAPDMVAPPPISAIAAAQLLRGVPDAAAAYAPPAKTDPHGSGRYWTDPEDKIIRDGYLNTVKLTVISEQLAAAGFRRRSVSAICTRAMALGCSSNSPIAKANWSPEEDQIVIAAYADPDVKIMEIVAMLSAAGFDRGRVAVQMRAINLGITRDRVNYWKDDEKAVAISGLEAGKSFGEIIQDLRKAGFHRGLTAINRLAKKEGLSRLVDPWTPAEYRTLVEQFEKKISPRLIAKQLGKTVSAVAAMASRMSLRQREAWTDVEKGILRKAQADGVQLIDVSSLLPGRTYATIQRMAGQLRLDFSRKRPAALKLAQMQARKARRK